MGVSQSEFLTKAERIIVEEQRVQNEMYDLEEKLSNRVKKLEEIKHRYEEDIKSLQLDKEALWDGMNRAIHEVILGEPKTKVDAKLHIDGNYDEVEKYHQQINKKVIQVEDFLSRLCNPEIVGEVNPRITVSITEDKSIKVLGFFSDTNNSIFINGGDVPETVYIHEFGHWLEYNRYIDKKGNEFLQKRTLGGEFKDTGTYYYKPDKFLNPYSGRVYPPLKRKNGGYYYANEILSVGLEMLYQNPAKLYRKDPEYFWFIISVVQGD